MNRPAIDDLLDKIDNKYTLAVLSAKRAREIVDGDSALVECKSAKPVTIALEEIVQEKITYQQTKDGIK